MMISGIKKIVLFFSMCFIWLGTEVYAQRMKDYFVQMPDSLCPLLTPVNRADFIDFLESKMKAEVSNRLGGKSEMTQLADDFLEIRMTKQSTWQFKLLPLNDSVKVICVAATVAAPVCDSHVEFYSTSWQKLPTTAYLPSQPLKLDDFLKPVPDSLDNYAFRSAYRQADVLFLKASLSPKDAGLRFTLTTTDYMVKEAAEQLKPLMVGDITYWWEKGRFIYKLH